MGTSQNGWPLITPAEYKAKTTSLKLISGRVRMGDVYTVLAYVAEQFNKRVEKINRKQSYGWSYRKIRGYSKWSNHASATAIDLNSSKHPLAASGTFTKKQQLAIKHILAECDGVVRWGGNYSGRKDEMHFEINLQPHASKAKVAALAVKIRAGKTTSSSNTPARAVTWTYPLLGRGASGSLVTLLQKAINRRHPLVVRKATGGALKVDGKFEDKTRAAVIAVQKHARLRVTGTTTQETWTHLGLATKVRKAK